MRYERKRISREGNVIKQGMDLDIEEVGCKRKEEEQKDTTRKTKGKKKHAREEREKE